jgi:hypothetical protein
MKEVTFTVTIDEANLILEGVGLLPFAKVYQLVGKLQEQARRQLNSEATALEGRIPERTPGT